MTPEQPAWQPPKNFTFDLETLDEEHRDWYDHCMGTMNDHNLRQINLSNLSDTEIEGNLSVPELAQLPHFNHPVDKLCQELLTFTMNPVSIFGKAWQNTMITTYTTLMIVGILTNLSVCWVVVRNSQARTARNLFIINMAFSDLTVCCITMPATVMKLINHTWKYGDLLCRLTSLLEGVNLLVSSGTASAIAGDRLRLVKRKTARQDDTKVTKIASIILLIWILGILAVLPTTFATVIYKFHFSTTEIIMKEICAEKWPHPVAHLLYSVGLMIVQYIIPISVILVTHTKIIGIVRQRTQAATSFRHSNRADVTIKKNRKTTQILLIIALMFGAHWLPYHIYTIGSQILQLMEVDWKLSEHNEFLAFFFVHSFAMLSTITNPILYGWLNTNLKHLFRAMIPTVRNERTEDDEAHELMNIGDGKHHDHTSCMGRRKSQTGDMNLNEDANCDTLEYIMYNSPSPQSPNGKKISNGHTTPHLNGNNAAFEFEEIELEGWKKDTVSDV